MTLFDESIKSHQELVDLLISYSNKNGSCALSQKRMAQKLNKCPSWISQAIRRLNREETCIIKTPKGYLVNIDDITAQGTFLQIIQTMEYLANNPTKFNENEVDIAKDLNIKRETLQAAKTYLRNSFSETEEPCRTKPPKVSSSEKWTKTGKW